MPPAASRSRVSLACTHTHACTHAHTHTHAHAHTHTHTRTCTHTHVHTHTHTHTHIHTYRTQGSLGDMNVIGLVLLGPTDRRITGQQNLCSCAILVSAARCTTILIVYMKATVNTLSILEGCVCWGGMRGRGTERDIQRAKCDLSGHHIIAQCVHETQKTRLQNLNPPSMLH